MSGTIVYEGDPIDGPDPARDFELWIIGAPDWKTQLLAGGPGFDGHPAWSPNGNEIVYVSHSKRQAELIRINPDGTNRTPIPSTSGDYPRWIAHGIVVKSAEGYKIVDPSSNLAKSFNLGPDVSDFAMSPDGTRMVVTKPASNGVHLFLAQSDGTLIRQLTNEHAREIHPYWSPDGKQIAYSGGDGTRTGAWDVYVVDADTGDRTRVTSNPEPDWACGWSPDGAWILLTSSYAANWDIYAIRPDGSDRLRISCHAGNARYAQWSAAEPLRH